MKYENIEETSKEIETILGQLRNTLGQSRDELSVSKASMTSIKTLNDLEKFMKSIKEASEKVTPEESLQILDNGVTKVIEFLTSEKTRIRDSVISLNERISVLTSVISHIESHNAGILAKKIAVDRVIEDGPDTSRPERIAVIREAERVKKSRNQNS